MDNFREQTDQEVENKLWFEKFDAALPEFKWFVEQYFPEWVELMLQLRKEENKDGLNFLLNKIWFHLPDGRFNIVVNPKGWRQFLSLIEE